MGIEAVPAPDADGADGRMPWHLAAAAGAGLYKPVYSPHVLRLSHVGTQTTASFEDGRLYVGSDGSPFLKSGEQLQKIGGSDVVIEVDRNKLVIYTTLAAIIDIKPFTKKHARENDH